jgi:hypothetical protein
MASRRDGGRQPWLPSTPSKWWDRGDLRQRHAYLTNGAAASVVGLIEAGVEHGVVARVPVDGHLGRVAPLLEGRSACPPGAIRSSRVETGGRDARRRWLRSRPALSNSSRISGTDPAGGISAIGTNGSMEDSIPG